MSKISELLNCSTQSKVAANNKLDVFAGIVPGPSGSVEAKTKYIEPAVSLEERPVHKEMVDHPNHYQGNKFEVIDIIEDYKLGFSLGNAVKYILRAGHKDDYVQDLKKAIWYLNREIAAASNVLVR